jgi:SAM-dependent methyltransferase
MDNKAWNERYLKSGPTMPSAHSVVLEEHVKDLSPGTALELAAGDGRNALYLARCGWKVTAVDFSEVALERGRGFADQLGLSVDWQLADLADAYRPAPQAYDLVCLFYLHLPKAEFHEILRRAADSLSPGGTLLVVGHDLRNLVEGTGGPRDPEVLYRCDELVTALAGLRIDYAGTEERAADHGVATDGCLQIDCVVKARAL